MTGAMYRSQRNWGARIRELTSHGLRLVEIENEHLCVGVLAGKGADIVEINVKRYDLDLVWLAPGGVRDPLSHAGTAPDTQEAFRENYPGAWQEMFPNAGVPSTLAGVAYGQHGEVFNRPWDVSIVEDTDHEVAVRFTIETRKVPCRLEKTLRIRAGEAGFRIEERLINQSPATVPAMWGHHVTFGRPFLVPGCWITLPAGITVTPQPLPVSEHVRRVSTTTPFSWPVDPGNQVDFRVIPERGTPSEMVFLSGFGKRAWYELARPGGPVGCRVAWDGERMPFLWFWQEFGNTIGYPWFGRLYTIGLEPCSSMPGGLADAVASGTALTLQPWEEQAFWLELSITAGEGGLEPERS
jgi:hypothetical protein